MNKTASAPSDEPTFNRMWAAIAQEISPTQRLPLWPFKTSVGYTTIFEFDRVLGETFGAVLASLCAHFGDGSVTLVALRPAAEDYNRLFGCYPGFVCEPRTLPAAYGDNMYLEPSGDPTGALNEALDVFALTGTSGSWAVWAQRDWELGLLVCQEKDGPWLHAGVPWFGDDLVLEDIRSPKGWGLALSDDDVGAFWRNIRARRPREPR